MTTPIIHPINEKKPDAVRRFRKTGGFLGTEAFLEYSDGNTWIHFRNGRAPVLCAPTDYPLDWLLKTVESGEWEELPLPPEVTPEQGKGETGWWCSSCQVFVPPKEVTYNETHDHRAGGCGTSVFQRKISPPASGPSPAAMEAAKEILMKGLSEMRDIRGSTATEALEARAAVLAAIIDRKFPREEDGAKVTISRSVKYALEKLKAEEGETLKTYEREPLMQDCVQRAKESLASIESILRAALQDSREGK